MNGTYGFVYSGAIGVGIGVFVVADSHLSGSDYAGGKYEGTVSVDPATGNITATFTLFAPGGMLLVQGTTPLPFDSMRGPIAAKMPPEFGDGNPVELDIPPGKIIVMVKRVPDEWARAANGFSLSIP
jgi:hypothetical protein